MSKDKKDKQPSAPKKGAIINRRNNRTIDPNRQQNTPKWQMVVKPNGVVTGVIQNKKTHQLMERDSMTGHWVGLSERELTRRLVPPPDPEPVAVEA